METNDFSLVLTKQFDARQYAQTIEDHVRQLAKEDGEKVVCLGTLDYVNFLKLTLNILHDMYAWSYHSTNTFVSSFARKKEFQAPANCVFLSPVMSSAKVCIPL